MRADALVASRRVAVARAEGRVAVARTSLYTLMAEPERGDDPGIAEDLQAPLPALTRRQPELTARALEARSEVLAIRAQLRSAELVVAADSSGKWPSVEVGGTAEPENPNPRWANNDRVFRPSWSVYASVRW